MTKKPMSEIYKKLKILAVTALTVMLTAGLTGCSDLYKELQVTVSQPVTYIGTKAPGEAKAVGDIVFNDGSSTPYTEDLTLTETQKNAAIAIIFYRGTDLNSGSDTTSRTLGVGLKQGSSLAWCTNDANAYNTKITTIQCTKSGDTTSSDKNGSDNLEQIGDFAGVSDTTDSTKYPAFYFAKKYSDTATNLGTSYKDDWYLPSIAELDQIYKNGKGTGKVYDIDAAIELCGGDKFGSSSYCSSSQFASGDKYAYTLDFANGGWNYDFKNSYRYVCAVREFNDLNTPDTPTSYTVNIATDIENGTVTASPTTAAAGDTITLTVTPNTGYELDTLTVKDAGNVDVLTTEVTKGESYTFTMTEGNVTVTATFKETTQASAYIGTKAPSEAKAVGDIVFNDGSATPYTEDLSLTETQKNAAIAIIFYKGTELNSGDDTSSRTLGVGLKQNTYLAWCTSNANAYNTNITTIQCTPIGNKGAYTFTGDKNGSDNLEQIAAFDGVSDTGTAENYPDFYFAKKYSDTATNLGTSYKDDWYLPTIAELFQIWKSKDTVNAASELCGGDQFNLNSYCSSSQYDSKEKYAYGLRFDDGFVLDCLKILNDPVCAVREFDNLNTPDTNKTAGSISYAIDTVDKTPSDGDFTNPLTHTGDGTVTYSSSNEAVATVNATTGEVTIVKAGTTKITATVADSASYTYATKTASYTLTVTIPLGPVFTVFRVSIADDIANGTVTASPTTAAAGTQITLTAEAASGYTFISFNVTDANGNAIAVTDNTFTMPESNVTVSATFIDNTLPAITLSCDTPTVTKGDVITGNVVFSNFEVTPATVDLYVEGEETGLLGIQVTDGTFTVNTKNLIAGTHKVYVKSGSVESNHISITINVPPLVFRASIDEVIAGDIAVSTDGGTTLKYVPAENWDSSLYSGYTPVGVCVNTSYMINLDNDEDMSWNAAMAKYPAGGWRMPTVEELKEICNVISTLNISLGRIPATKLQPSYYWSSTSKDGNDNYAYTVYFAFGLGEESDKNKLSEEYVRVVRELTSTTYIGTKAPSEAKAVGDIVFNDGSATPYTDDLTLDADHKNAAIAVIFYVGTGLNSGDDTTTSRTLGVGLKHHGTQPSAPWCSNSANACYMNITTIQCPASGPAGELTFTGDKNGSDNLEQIGEFLAANGSSDDTTGDGADGRYPAFYFAKNYANQEESRVNGTSYADNWYLPSIAELDQICKNRETVEAASEYCGGDTFGNDWYRSSSQYPYNDDYADAVAYSYGLFFFDGGWYHDDKTYHSYEHACAVREF